MKLLIPVLALSCLCFGQVAWAKKKTKKLKKKKYKTVPVEPSKTSYKIKFGLINRYFNEENISSGNLFGITVGGYISRFLDEEDLIKAHFEGYYLQEFGVSQDRFGENLPQNGLNVKNAYIDMEVYDSKLKVGALSQSDVSEPLIIQNQVFPGVRWNYLPSKNFVLGVQAALPTSNDLKDNRVDDEELPTSYRAHLKWSSDFGLELQGVFYSFNNLTSKTAQDSGIRGNSVVTLTREKSVFKYDYQITAARVSQSLELGFVSPRLSYLAFKNLEADDSFSLGQEVSAGLKFKGAWNLALSASYFFVESDASIANYSSYEIGHNNRKGYMAGIYANILGSQVGVKMVQSETINQSIYQNKLTHFSTDWRYSY